MYLNLDRVTVPCAHGTPADRRRPSSAAYYEYFAPDLCLHVDSIPRQENGNTKAYIESIIRTTQDNLRMVEFAPR